MQLANNNLFTNSIMIEKFISNLLGGSLTPEALQAARSQLKRSPIRMELLEAKRKLKPSGEVYKIQKGKICPPGKKLTKNKRCISRKRKSRKVKSPKRKSKKVKSPKRKSPKRKSKKVKSPKRKSPKRKSPKRKSKKVKSPKRKSKKVKSPKRKSLKGGAKMSKKVKSPKRMSKDRSKVIECIKRKRRSGNIRSKPKCSIDKCYSRWRTASKC